MEGPLTPQQIRSFILDGFVRLEAAFSRALAEECCQLLWVATGLDPNDRAGWTTPMIRLPHSDAEPFVRAATTPRLLASFDQLVGRGRWHTPTDLGTFPVRFPSDEIPAQAGWHIDSSYPVGDDSYLNLWSRKRALLMLFFFTDIGLDDAPSRIYVGSHLDIPQVLLPAGPEGMSVHRLMGLIPRVHEREVAVATGSAGDVYLCHPFLVHGASWPHRGQLPRFIAQPRLDPVGPLQLARAIGDYSPVEIAVRVGLGLEPPP
jgi:hypothetical protein